MSDHHRPVKGVRAIGPRCLAAPNVTRRESGERVTAQVLRTARAVESRDAPPMPLVGGLWGLADRMNPMASIPPAGHPLALVRACPECRA